MKGKSKNLNPLLDAIAYFPSTSTIHFDFYLSSHLCLGEFEGSDNNPLPSCLHSHNEYEFIIPSTPVYYLLRDENIYFGQVGWVFPSGPNVPHGIKYSQDQAKFDIISIDKEYFEEIKRSKNCSRHVIDPGFAVSNTLRDYIIHFKEECKRRVRDEENKVEPLARLIAAELIDLSLEAERPKSPRKNTVYQQGIRSVAAYINAHFDEDLSLETLSAIAGLSESYFTRSFKKMYDCSPSVYIAKVRVSNAKMLLENTLLSVKDIARKVGYNHSSTFCDAFRKEEKKSPNEYRAEYLGYKEGLQCKQ